MRFVPAFVLLVAACGSGETPAEPAEPIAPAAGAAPEAATAAAPPAAKAARRFLEVSGGVQLDGKAAAADMEIPAAAKIVTAADGRAVITLQPGDAIEIRKNTTVDLGASDKRKNALKLIVGAIWSFLPQGSSYEVAGPNAVAGVRGTVFYMEAKNDKDTYICACDGDVEIETANKKSFSKTISSKMEHKAFRFLTKGKKQVSKKEKRLNHTDAEKDAVMPWMEKSK